MLRDYRKGWTEIASELDRLTCSTIPVSEELISALIVAEDHRFKKHSGVDALALIRAAWRTVACGRREGGSTIAMQLVRVLTGNYDQSLKRKFVEILLALKLTKLIGRTNLPRYYLGIAYFGWKMNGLKQAAERLGIERLDDISSLQAANLVARLKYPEPKCPSSKREQQIYLRTEYVVARTKMIGDAYGAV